VNFEHKFHNTQTSLIDMTIFKTKRANEQQQQQQQQQQQNNDDV
jgi:hypothetical protein